MHQRELALPLVALEEVECAGSMDWGPLKVLMLMPQWRGPLPQLMLRTEETLRRG